MINIKQYIFEKLILNKNISSPNNCTCNIQKFFKCTLSEAQWLYKNYFVVKDIKKFFNITTDVECDLGATPLELLTMFCWMLIDDGYKADVTSKYIDLIGTNDYPGQNNPYDYSWFEEDTNAGEDCLDSVKQWIKSNKEAQKFFDFIQEHYINIKSTEDIFNMIEEIVKK